MVQRLRDQPALARNTHAALRKLFAWAVDQPLVYLLYLGAGYWRPTLFLSLASIVSLGPLLTGSCSPFRVEICHSALGPIAGKRTLRPIIDDRGGEGEG
jgi:hypothetical protein